MAVYPKGKKFMASFGAGASRVRKTFNTAAEGEAWEVDMERLRAASKALNVPEPVKPSCWNLQKAFDETSRNIWKGRPGEGKANVNANAAMAFFGGDTPTSEITANWIIEWMDELQTENENSPATCNRKLSALRVMLTRAVEFGGLQALPRIKRYKESKHRIRWFSDAEEAQMLAMCKHLKLHDLHDFIIVGIDTGFRRMELLRLTPSDYVQGDLLAHAGETKNGEARAVPTTARVKAILEARKALPTVFHGLTVAKLRNQWEDIRGALDKAEDAAFIVHVLRHTCATRLAAEGVPLPEIMAWMGHKVIQTTMRYAHLMPGALRGAAARLESRQAAH